MSIPGKELLVQRLLNGLLHFKRQSHFSTLSTKPEGTASLSKSVKNR
jgi:hypothetical protein